MKYVIDLDKYEINTLKSIANQEYYREEIRYQSKFLNDVDRDLLSDSMRKLKRLIAKLNDLIEPCTGK